jgi:hypothetical protein
MRALAARYMSSRHNALPFIKGVRRDKISALCVALSIGLSSTAAFGRGGMGSSHMMGSSPMSVTAGASGTSAATPGTNSLGTALSSFGTGLRLSGPLLSPSPAIDREEAKVEKILSSICRGC